MNTDTDTDTDIEFSRIEPDTIDAYFDIDFPEMEAGDLAWEDLVCLLTLSYYFLSENVPIDDLAMRYGVTPASVEAMLEEKLPAYSWWRSLLSRAREAHYEDPEQEKADWSSIGGVSLGFYALHLSFDDYPLSIPDMRRLYVDAIEKQGRMLAQGFPPAYPVIPAVDVPKFLKQYKRFTVALRRRIEAITSILDDTALNRPLFSDPREES